MVFDFIVEKKQIKMAYIQDPLVLWRPRLSFRDYCIQLFRYTRGDGHAGLFLVRQLIRYVTYVIGVILIMLAIQHHWFLIVLGGGVLIYSYKFYKRWFIFSKNKPTLIKII